MRMKTASKIKVLIVDDSALVRQTMSEILGSDANLEVIGAAADPVIALHKMKDQLPDVIDELIGILACRVGIRACAKHFLRPLDIEKMVAGLIKAGAFRSLDMLHMNNLQVPQRVQGLLLLRMRA